MKEPSSKLTLFAGLRAVAIPALILTFFWLTTVNDVSIWQGTLAFILILWPWQSYWSWKQKPRNYFPLFPLISSMYCLFFAVQLFWEDQSQGMYSQFSITGDAITGAMLMAVLGVSCIWLGMRTSLGLLLIPKTVPDIAPRSGHRSYLRFLLVLGILGAFMDSPYMFGEGGRQMLVIFTNIIPTIGFAILFRLLLTGQGGRLDKILVVSFLAIRFLLGLSSGWLGSAAGLLIICLAIYVVERGRMPKWVVAVAVLYVIFFQVGKSDMRGRYWQGGEQGGRVEKVEYWFNASLSRWSEAIENPSGESIRDLAAQSLTRTSLLPQAANVLQKTPEVVPYQYGALYSYLAVTLVPRFVWPEKPSVSGANQFYQVNYGLTEEHRLDQVSIAVGALVESYINFGWPGVIAIMFLMGVFYNFFEQTFLTENSGLLFKGIGVVMLPSLMGIESQLAQYLGGLIQQVLFALLLMLPIITYRRTRKSDLSPVVRAA